MYQFDFPPSFLWGCATAAIQIEGGIDADGRTPGLWDAEQRRAPQKFWNGNDYDRDIADFYHHYREHIANMGELGLKSFRMSLSWSRILPQGRGSVNERGLDFYDRVIDALLEKGIEPLVDLYHWDLPECLNQEGNFLRDGIADDFEAYAEVCFRRFGDRVRHWSTLNEPHTNGFNCLKGDPRFNLSDPETFFHYVRNVMRMHHRAVRKYREVVPAGKGEIGAVTCYMPVYPKSFDEKDMAAAIRQEDFSCNLWFDGFLTGRCPESLLTFPKLSCPARDRLQQELQDMFLPADFIGVNYYFPGTIGYKPGTLLDSEGIRLYEAQDNGFVVYSPGMYDTLMFFKKRYGNPKVYITENGFASDHEIHGDDLEDPGRINYLREHLRQVSRAIQAGANVQGYYVWSLMDTFETENGMKYQFGLNHVNLETKELTKRKSWYFYQTCIRRNQVF